MHFSSSPKNGFTIIEVLVALVLLSVAVLMTLKLTTQNQEALSRTHFRERATILAQQKLFELDQEGISALTASSGRFENFQTDYSWEAAVYSTGRPSTYRLQIKVMWGEKNNNSVTIEKVFTE